MVLSKKSRTIVRVENEVKITEFDVDLVQALSYGDTLQEVATKLKMNVRTIEARVDKLKIRTGYKNIPHLVAMFMRQKLID